MGLDAELRRTGEWERLQPVRNLYLNTLVRDPLLGDRAALHRWIDSGQPLANVEHQLAESSEGRWVRAGRDLYLELLGRDPIPDDRAGLRSWYQASLDHIRDRLMQSAEYLARQEQPP
ncbi:MAG: hypothetical protein EXR52_07675 [Dehalococcoidia bacterium]|nr:hypothetical protein [Dehalococcoidia bacterium]